VMERITGLDIDEDGAVGGNEPATQSEDGEEAEAIHRRQSDPKKAKSRRLPGFHSVGKKKMMKLFRHATRHLTGSVLTADQSLFITFIVATVKVVLWMQIVPILVEQIEIAVDSIVAILGALTVGVGPALKPLAENFVMGAVLTWVRPFKIGDLVEISSGVLGIVQTTSLAYTTVKNPSGQIVHVPNSKIALMPMIDRR
jgi:small-conductance mechanosensitive channel